jgi:hypothetical protein
MGNLENAKDLGNEIYSKVELDAALVNKQEKLQSGFNIKSINNVSLLGSGNLDLANAALPIQTNQSGKYLQTDGASASWEPLVVYNVNGYTVLTNVPQGAVFTDTTYNLASQNEAGLMSSQDKYKIDNMDSNASLLNRNNHTGQQLAGTISDFTSSVISIINTEIPANEEIASNTALRHSHVNKNAIDLIDQDLSTAGDVDFNTLTVNGLVATGTLSFTELIAPIGPYNITSNTTINFTSDDGTRVHGGAFRPTVLTTAQRDALIADNGDIVYNSTLDKFQGFQGGTWINLDGTV